MSTVKSTTPPAWEDPPPAHPRRTRWAKITAELQERPGQWRRLGTFPKRYAYNAAPATARRWGLQYTTRVADEGLVTLYARWPE